MKLGEGGRGKENDRASTISEETCKMPKGSKRIFGWHRPTSVYPLLFQDHVGFWGEGQKAVGNTAFFHLPVDLGTRFAVQLCYVTRREGL
jgi:hypothetical protein